MSDNFQSMREVLKKITDVWEQVTCNEFNSKAKLLGYSSFDELKRYIEGCLMHKPEKGVELMRQGLPTLETFVLMYPNEFGKENVQKALTTLQQKLPK